MRDCSTGVWDEEERSENRNNTGFFYFFPLSLRPDQNNFSSISVLYYCWLLNMCAKWPPLWKWWAYLCRWPPKRWLTCIITAQVVKRTARSARDVWNGRVAASCGKNSNRSLTQTLAVIDTSASWRSMSPSWYCFQLCWKIHMLAFQP